MGKTQRSVGYLQSQGKESRVPESYYGFLPNNTMYSHSLHWPHGVNVFQIMLHTVKISDQGLGYYSISIVDTSG